MAAHVAIVGIQFLGILVYTILIVVNAFFIKLSLHSARPNKKRLTMLALNFLCLLGQIPWFLQTFRAMNLPHDSILKKDHVLFWIITGYIGTFHMAEISYMLFEWIETVAFVEDYRISSMLPRLYKTFLVAGAAFVTAILSSCGVVILSILPLAEGLYFSRFIFYPFIIQSMVISMGFATYGYRLRRLISSHDREENSFLVRNSLFLHRLNKLNITLFVCINAITLYYILVILSQSIAVHSTFPSKLYIPCVYLLPCISVPVSILWFFNPLGTAQDIEDRTRFENWIENQQEEPLTIIILPEPTYFVVGERV